jgi:hypothetical protein
MVILLAGVGVALVALVVMVLVATEAVAGTPALTRAHHPKEQMALAGAVEVASKQGNLAEVVMV